MGSGAAGDGPAPSSGRPALRRCTHLAWPEFADRVWGRHPSLSTAVRLAEAAAADGRDAAPVVELLTLAQVDELLSVRGLRTPFLRVAKQGRTLPPARFTRTGGVGATVGDQADDVALARLFADGHTVVLQGLHRLHRPVVEFAQQLTADLGHPVQVNAYLTPASSQGFADHYDVHDVFVIQFAGSKRWLIRPPVLTHPARDQPWTDRRAEVERAAQDDPLLDVVLSPGDVLYLPAGYLHAARSLDQVSGHLTVGVHPWTRSHLIEQLTRALSEVEELRRPLSAGFDVADPDAVASELLGALDLMHTHLDTVGAPRVAAALAGSARTGARAEPVAPLAQAELLASMDAGTPLRLRRHLRGELVGTDADLRLVTVDGDHPVTPDERESVLRLLEGQVLTVGRIGSELAHSLVRRALLVAP